MGTQCEDPALLTDVKTRPLKVGAVFRRRRYRYAAPSRRAGSMFVGRPARRRRRRFGPAAGLVVVLLALVAGGVGVFVALHTRHAAQDRQRRAAAALVAAWARKDQRAMYAQLSAAARRRYPF